MTFSEDGPWEVGGLAAGTGGGTGGGREKLATYTRTQARWGC